MAAIAVYAADPNLRRRLEGSVAAAAPGGLIGAAGDPAALLRLVDQGEAAVILAAIASLEADAVDWAALARRAGLVMLLEDAAGMVEALQAGASAILGASASAEDIALALAVVARGHKLLPGNVLGLILPERAPAGEGDETGGMLTRRELDVLAALADGASNKAIARRLGISFHTVKFHVASILAKLDAESRTEAVAQAARLGLVML